MYQDFFDKNDDYLNDFKQKVANQKIATVEERRSEMARSRNNFLSIFAGIALAGVVGWFVLSPQYAEENSEIPVIHRPQSAIKIRPENPGGMEIPNQDKDVYNIVEKKEVDNTVVENLLPTPETPKLPDIVPDTSDIDETTANLDEIVDEVADIEDTAEASAETINQKAENTVEQAKEKISADIKTATTEALEASEKINHEEVKKESAQKVEEKTDVKAEIKNVAKTETASAKSEEKTQAPAQQANGKWQIQLVASKNKASVEKTWNDLSNRYPVLKSYTHEIQTSDLGAQGIFYRLRAGSFADKNAAAAACAALKKQGLNDCITKER